jgi:hypothetical protein
MTQNLEKQNYSFSCRFRLWYCQRKYGTSGAEIGGALEVKKKPEAEENQDLMLEVLYEKTNQYYKLYRTTSFSTRN